MMNHFGVLQCEKVMIILACEIPQTPPPPPHAFKNNSKLETQRVLSILHYHTQSFLIFKQKICLCEEQCFVFLISVTGKKKKKI